MTKLNAAHAPNAEIQLRSAVLSSLGSIDRDFWDENVPCMALLLYSTRQARDWLSGVPPQLHSMSIFIRRPPGAACTDPCTFGVLVVLVLHFDCDDTDECPVFRCLAEALTL